MKRFSWWQSVAPKTNGKTVMVINVGELLRKGGVVEQLKAQGLAIEGPGE